MAHLALHYDNEIVFTRGFYDTFRVVVFEFNNRF